MYLVTLLSQLSRWLIQTFAIALSKFGVPYFPYQAYLISHIVHLLQQRQKYPSSVAKQFVVKLKRHNQPHKFHSWLENSALYTDVMMSWISIPPWCWSASKLLYLLTTWPGCCVMDETATSGICGVISSFSCGICAMDEDDGYAETSVVCAASVGCATYYGFAITCTLTSEKLSWYLFP